MNPNIKKLYAVASKPQRLVIGLMSGTSLDGLDAVLCNISNSGLQTKIDILQFETVAYDDEFKKEIKTIFSKEEISLQQLTLLNPWIALQHAAIINALLKKWNIKNEAVDIIAS